MNEVMTTIRPDASETNELDERLLLKYLQGECAPEDFAAIDLWLDGSEDNRRRLFDLELSCKASLRRFHAGADTVSGAWGKLMHRIGKAEQAGKTKKRRVRLIRSFGWGSAAAVFGLAAVLLLTGPAAEKFITVTVAPNEAVKELLMPDGTKIWLNKASTLKYPESFSAENRRVSLDGEAYFEVAWNAESPFTVNSRTMQITVLGTTFNINDNADVAIADATLIEGEIEIKGNNDEGHVILAPGQRAELDLSARRMSIKSVNARLDGVWHNNLIPFNDAPVYEIARTLEQLYGVRIAIAPGIYDNKRYTGFIRRRDSIDEVLGSLRNSIPMDYTVSGKEIAIKPSDKSGADAQGPDVFF